MDSGAHSLQIDHLSVPGHKMERGTPASLFEMNIFSGEANGPGCPLKIFQKYSLKGTQTVI